MNNLVVLYVPSSTGYAHDKVFSNKSAIEKSTEWSNSLSNCVAVEFIYGSDFEKYENDNTISLELLLKKISILILQHKADTVIFAWADCPFLNSDLTETLLRMHANYRAEYTFAEGLPYGFSPEIIHSGTISILQNLLDSKKDVVNTSLTRDSIFSLIKTDINSFEIETYMAENDYRYLRCSFSCSTKRNTVACINLFNECKEVINDIEQTCKIISGSASVQRTLPAFYNIQIKSPSQQQVIYEPVVKQGEMDLDSFKALLENIYTFSEDAVISLSFLGDPLYHEHFIDFATSVLTYNTFSLILETDAVNLTQGLLDQLINCVQKNPVLLTQQRALNWIIRLDALDSDLYCKIHPNNTDENFRNAENSILYLKEKMPFAVYPQFVRMNCNEHQLEGFFRKWTADGSTNIIIQKFDHISHLLHDEKPTDLSPINRYACWHIKRDMNILADGTVVRCKAAAFAQDKDIAVLGNVFEEELSTIWDRGSVNVTNQLKGIFTGQCGESDEYYTFNF